MLNMKWTLSAVVLAAAFAGTASAQSEHYRGSFKLLFEARFGNVVLEPGDYTVSSLGGAHGLRIVGDKGTVSILAAGTDVKPATESARMTFVDSDGMYALQSFESGAMGQSLQFHVKKNSRGPVERASVKPTIEVGMQ